MRISLLHPAVRNRGVGGKNGLGIHDLASLHILQLYTYFWRRHGVTKWAIMIQNEVTDITTNTAKRVPTTSATHKSISGVKTIAGRKGERERMACDAVKECSSIPPVAITIVRVILVRRVDVSDCSCYKWTTFFWAVYGAELSTLAVSIKLISSTQGIRT
mmetsp:Transcript_21687/g.60365  ORF Transcript_21687/g.60365 Transcript_21687/m.60365 type:complete len:160 (+) Transcript_21687:835-1314(+)